MNIDKYRGFNHDQLCTALSELLTRKHNLLLVPADLGNQHAVQEDVTAVTDDILALSIVFFGSDAITDYCGGRDSLDFTDPHALSLFNAMVDKVDKEVSISTAEVSEIGHLEYGEVVAFQIHQILRGDRS